MTRSSDVIIIGGGLAGLTCAIHLSIKGMKVLLIEKHPYPKHKVCGEYISNEVLPYLNALGFDPFEHGATRITRLTLSTARSNSITVNLPRGGFGISRYRIDAALAKLAAEKGANITQATVQEIDYDENQFKVLTNQGEVYSTSLVIGAFGKRSNLDVHLDREFMSLPAPNLAVKAHYSGVFPDDLVGLHNFKGGYCGVSKVEDDRINVCYITDLNAFKKHKNIVTFQQEVMSKNRYLRAAFDHMEMEFKNPVTISNISFHTKNPVKDHVLMCGDSAGMIHPLAGNGMSMAIRSAQMLSLLILKYKSGKITSRTNLETSYATQWNESFSTRLRWGRVIEQIFRRNILSEIILILLKIFPFLLSLIIRNTHGKPMKPEI